jgi:ankyrin repeat protein
VAGEGYQRRRETTTAVMAAIGMGGGTPWAPVSRAELETLTFETVKLALELGVDPNVKTVNGRTALDAARTAKFASVVKLLEDQGAQAGTAATGQSAR